MYNNSMNNKITNDCYGKCRFCFAKGYRDLMKAYDWNGIREIYYDIFQECFNIYLTTNSDRTCLICLSCVTKLRQANTFRKMVVRSEQQFLDVLDNKGTVFINVGKKIETEKDEKQEKEIEIKDEIIGDTDEDSFVGEDLDAGMKIEIEKEEKQEKRIEIKDEILGDTDEDSFVGEDLDDTSSLEEVYGEAELLSRFQPVSIKPLPTRNDLYYSCKEYVKQLDLLKGKQITAKSLEKFMDTQCIGKIYVTEKIAHVNNITTLLENSNLAAFKKKRRSVLPCFYCRKVCANFEELLQHQNISNCKINLKRILSKYRAECLVVYAYVKDLKCTICGQNVRDVNELRIHLVRVHQKNYYSGYEDRVIPFSFSKNEYECQVCKFNFETFGSIERHMKVHFRNYVCEQCGAGYITKNRLKVHLRYSHVTGVFPCETCNKTFATRYKYQAHVDLVHKMMKKNKCSKCPARFSDYFIRDKHMVEVHGDPPLRFKCNVCGTLFKRRYALSCHMRRRHLEVRDIQCTICPYKCYTNTELKVHMIKHNGERTYECTVCKKSYARKKTLKEHIRIHNNDRRYVCMVCAQSFVQNCSLKGHMKAHHRDVQDGNS